MIDLGALGETIVSFKSGIYFYSFMTGGNNEFVSITMSFYILHDGRGGIYAYSFRNAGICFDFTNTFPPLSSWPFLDNRNISTWTFPLLSSWPFLDNKKVYTWGQNTYCQLMRNGKIDSSVPTPVWGVIENWERGESDLSLFFSNRKWSLFWWRQITYRYMEEW